MADTKEIQVTTEYTVRKTFTMTVPADATEEEILEGKYDQYDDEISQEDEDSYWESGESIVEVEGL